MSWQSADKVEIQVRILLRYQNVKIMKNKDLLLTFEYEDLKVETFWDGGQFVSNRTFINGVLVYEDETFKPSTLHCIDDTQTMVSLLGFLTLRRGDIGDEFFSDRDSQALELWAENEEEVRMMIYDYDCKDDDTYLLENEMTYEEVTRIEKYIKIH